MFMTDDLINAGWRKSRRSHDQGACVELAEVQGGVIAVRDSQDPDGPKLAFTSALWAAFLSEAKSGTHDA